jgi:hypothetical protein
MGGGPSRRAPGADHVLVIHSALVTHAWLASPVIHSGITGRSRAEAIQVLAETLRAPRSA